MTWQAAGGTISGTGLYTAGAAPGSYPVVATETSTGLAAQAAVTLTATLIRVVDPFLYQTAPNR